jgi:hypothetical protein
MVVLCEVSGCGRETEKRGWCGRHYQRWRKHGDPLINQRERNKDRQCAAAGCSGLAYGRGTQHGYCKQHGWLGVTWQYRRDAQIKHEFGITGEEYRARLAAQGGVCVLCRRPETAVRVGRVMALAVDHDHVTGRIRGLLCSTCNRTLGYVESHVPLDRLANYLGGDDG